MTKIYFFYFLFLLTNFAFVILQNVRGANKIHNDIADIIVFVFVFLCVCKIL